VISLKQSSLEPKLLQNVYSVETYVWLVWFNLVFSALTLLAGSSDT